MLPEEFSIELGWIYLVPTLQHRGLSRFLLDPLLNIIGRRLVFATTRHDNGAMKHLLLTKAFHLAGVPYPSEGGDYKINLFVRTNADQSGDETV